MLILHFNKCYAELISSLLL